MSAVLVLFPDIFVNFCLLLLLLLLIFILFYTETAVESSNATLLLNITN
jgi:hypothetical protein